MDEKPITPFDELITPTSLQLLKLFIPYIPPDQQRTFAIYEKYLELKSTVDFYQNQKRSIHMQSDTSEDISFSTIFETMKPYLSEKDKEMMNSISSAMSMMEMFQEFQNMEENNGNEPMGESPNAEEFGPEETEIDTDSL